MKKGGRSPLPFHQTKPLESLVANATLAQRGNHLLPHGQGPLIELFSVLNRLSRDFGLLGCCLCRAVHKGHTSNQ